MRDKKLEAQLKAIKFAVKQMNLANAKKEKPHDFPKERYFKALEYFEVERRTFLKGEIYPAYLLDLSPYGEADVFYALVAENGEFNLGNNLLDILPAKWPVVEVSHD